MDADPPAARADQRVYLGAIAYELGDTRAVCDLPELASDDAQRLAREQGFDRYHASLLSAETLLARAAARTLERAGVAAAEVPFLVYATQRYGATLPERTALHEALCGLGMRHAYPIGVCRSACNNLVPALRIASALVRSGAADNVLVAVADVVPESESRVLRDLMGVMSDGAATCLLSSRPGGFELVGLQERSDAALGSAFSGDHEVRRLIGKYLAGTRSTLKDLSFAHGMTGGELSWLIPHNTCEPMVEMLQHVAGIGPARVFTRNIALHGHVQAADLLLNLHDCHAETPLVDGELALLLTMADQVWGAALVRKC